MGPGVWHRDGKHPSVRPSVRFGACWVQHSAVSPFGRNSARRLAVLFVVVIPQVVELSCGYENNIIVKIMVVPICSKQ